MAWWDDWGAAPSDLDAFGGVAARDNPFLATRPYDSLLDLWPDTTYGGLWAETDTDWSEYLPTYASRTGINQAYDLYDLLHPNPYENPASLPQGSTAPTAAPGAAFSGETWDNIRALDPSIQEATQISGTPSNLIRAVMSLESGGVWSVQPESGATGYMQVMPGIWNGSWGLNVYNPRENIILGGMILRDNFGKCGSWQGAVTAYFTGGCVTRGATDALGTDDWTYTQTIWNRYLQLESAGVGQTPYAGMGPPPTPGSYGTSTVGPPAGSAFWALTGGQVVPITQGHGMTDFAQGNVQPGGMYSYTGVYTRNGQPLGHAGVDVGIPVGTPVYTPVGGTVVCAGTGVSNGEDGCTAYTSDVCASSQCGRFQLKLPNNDMLIIGHMASVTVRPGDVINAGTAIGTGGTANGPHVHVEYRRWVGAGVTPSGWEAVDPRAVFSGAIGTLNLVEGTGIVPGGTQPWDFHSLIRSIQTGRNPFVTEGYLASGPSWLRQRITGYSGFGGVGSAPGTAPGHYPLPVEA